MFSGLCSDDLQKSPNDHLLELTHPTTKFFQRDGRPKISQLLNIRDYSHHVSPYPFFISALLHATRRFPERRFSIQICASFVGKIILKFKSNSDALT